MTFAATVKIEIEFTAGVWTDVTADMDNGAGVAVRLGRSSPQQTPQTSSLTLSLRNPTGKYTPGLQVLSDGTTAPYYPNVVPRKRVRYSLNSTVRWLGYVQSWEPMLDNGVTGRCRVQALDRFDQLSRVTLQPAIRAATAGDGPVHYWPLTDPQGSTSAYNLISVEQPLALIGSGASPAFGTDGPGSTEGTAVDFGPTAVGTGKLLFAQIRNGPDLSLGHAYSFEIWVKTWSAAPTWGDQNVLGIADSSGNSLAQVYIEGSSGHPVFLASNGLGSGSTSLFDDNWHMLTVTVTAAGLATFYVDGVSQGTDAGAGLAAPALLSSVEIGDATNVITSPARFAGSAGQLSIYATALSGAQVTAHWTAGHTTGETVDARIARFLGYAGLTASDWDLNASTVTLGTYDQAGKDVVTACQDMVASEGGGAVLYVLAGKVTFRSRRFRSPTAATLSIDADTDLARDTYQPSEDSQVLVNTVTANRATASGTAATATVTDAASVTANGVYTGSEVTTYTNVPYDTLHLAESMVAQGRTPAFRLPQVAVDLLTAQHNLYASVLATEIGSRIRVTNIPAAAAPATQLDLMVEGWSETVNRDQALIVYDTSAADNPARGVFNDAAYGSYQCDGQTLNAAITKTATTVVIATTAGKPTFTTTGGAYPLKIQVAGEHIQLNSAPGGSSSPQTFTGVTRAADGTAAAAQASGAAVAISPRATYAL